MKKIAIFLILSSIAWIQLYGQNNITTENGSTVITGPPGATLTLKKPSSNVPALVFQGQNNSTIIESGDDYLTAYLGNARRLTILANGNVGINTVVPKETLSVNGKIRAHEVKVEVTGWPDYVFNSNHELPSLQDVKAYVNQHHHLPEVPSEHELMESGLKLGEMNALLMKKVEELTLYLIEKDDKEKQHEARLKSQETLIEELTKRLTALERKK